MDINFHYAAIKAIAQHAGFSSAESEVIAYASQYVDDATTHEAIYIDKDPQVDGIRFSPDSHGGEFDPICTAHKELDYAKAVFNKDARVRVYACFHFIPCLKGADTDAKKQTRRNGALAATLVKDALGSLKGASGQARLRALIRLGIALHSFADTWAHQGFSGFWDSRNNDVRNLKVKTSDSPAKWESVDLVSAIWSYASPDIGHAEAGALPDRSDVSWSCEPGKMTKRRDNCSEFLKASERILTLLSGATGTGKAWSTIRPKLKRCFMKPVSEPAALRKKNGNVWAQTFKTTSFKYDEKKWFEEALRPKGGFLDWVGSGLGIDPKDYEILDGKHYFLFHAEAQRQREAVNKEIRKHGLHK